MKTNLKLLDPRRGQSLFEVVFAVGIAALIIVGVVALANRTLGNSNASNDKALATRLVQEMTECLRRERDTDWDEFVSGGIGTCTGEVSPPVGFTHAITFPPSGNPKVIDAEIEVTWTDGVGIHEVRTITRFTDWRRE